MTRLNNIWADFLNTPGYNTDDAAKAGGHEKYMRTMRSGGKSDLAQTIKEFHEFHMTRTSEASEEEEMKIAGKKLTSLIVDDVEQNDEEASELDMLAIEVADYFQSEPKMFMLTAPATLTVKKSDGKFAKNNHIGGESFMPIGAYVGKRNGLIFVFKPTTATAYSTVEMTDQDAKRLLSGFHTYLSNSLNHSFDNTMKELRAEAARKKELLRAGDKSKNYGEDFASW